LSKEKKLHSIKGQMNRAINHKSFFDFVYVFALIVLTVGGQLVLKLPVTKAGAFPQSFPKRALFLLPRETATMAKMFGVWLIMTGNHHCRPSVRFGFNIH
jgi:hypothetical protein